MDLSLFPPFAVVLDGLSSLVALLAQLTAPVAGGGAWALAIVLLTVLVRLALLPVAVSQVRAEIARRRLAPRIADLRRRIRNPEALNRAVLKLYTDEKVSPLAGCLPTIAQAPVLTAVYSLFTHPVLAGQANALLGHSLWGMPLGANLLPVLSGAASAWPLLALLVVLVVVVELSRRANARFTGFDASAQQAVPGMATLARVLPFASVAFAAIAPFAAALYLTASAAWTLGERAMLRRLLA
ncbi:membrane protein insertase YidC [Naasia sp. SYSU D00057]|uniref:YidC/Oxa1 family membrane protein insertase n=1 Tax=Naasia sp. SYSU D00057 TaxID=2817380 RepID=UPI001B3170B7|nr:membrane protein insertase YidC [Naasia sp. SYSU D00057]